MATSSGCVVRTASRCRERRGCCWAARSTRACWRSRARRRRLGGAARAGGAGWAGVGGGWLEVSWPRRAARQLRHPRITRRRLRAWPRDRGSRSARRDFPSGNRRSCAATRDFRSCGRRSCSHNASSAPQFMDRPPAALYRAPAVHGPASGGSVPGTRGSCTGLRRLCTGHPRLWTALPRHLPPLRRRVPLLPFYRRRPCATPAPCATCAAQLARTSAPRPALRCPRPGT